MKAKLITGEIVEVYKEFNGTFTELCAFEDEPRIFEPSAISETYLDEPEILTTSFDWESFRNETAAKLIVCYESFHPYNKQNTYDAINKTDELISQLKNPTP